VADEMTECLAARVRAGQIEDRKDLASELARRCHDSENFEGDLNVSQASHVLKELREILVDIGEASGETSWVWRGLVILVGDGD